MEDHNRNKSKGKNRNKNNTPKTAVSGGNIDNFTGKYTTNHIEITCKY